MVLADDFSVPAHLESAGRRDLDGGAEGNARHRRQDTVLKVRYCLLILVAKTVNLSEKRVAPAFAWVQADRVRSDVQCPLVSGAPP